MLLEDLDFADVYIPATQTSLKNIYTSHGEMQKVTGYMNLPPGQFGL